MRTARDILTMLVCMCVVTKVGSRVVSLVMRDTRGPLTGDNLRRRTRRILYDDDATLWGIHTCASAVRTG